MQDGNGKIPLSKKVKDALLKGIKLIYAYDFDNTTLLQVNHI